MHRREGGYVIVFSAAWVKEDLWCNHKVFLQIWEARKGLQLDEHHIGEAELTELFLQASFWRLHTWNL